MADDQKVDFIAPSQCVPFENKYHLLEQLGQGCCAVVYKCIAKESGECFAVKPQCLNSLAARDRECLKNEVRIQSALAHSNVVKLEEVLYWEGMHAPTQDAWAEEGICSTL